jgi:dephospho-CoA kinase
MLKVGVTGGIGSGKSTICKIFEALDIKIFYADTEAKNLLDTHEVIEFYIKEFGPVVFTNKQLDKQKIAQLIFSNPSALHKVNSFIHPKVNSRFNDWCLKFQSEPYIIKEAALLFETGAYLQLDYNILIVAPMELKITRTAKRDVIPRDQILERANSQWNDEKKIPLANAIVSNDNNELLIPQVLKLDKKIRSLENKKI